MMDFEEVEKNYSQRVRMDDIDFATVALCYINILTGACYALGFKYAGTGNENAKKLIINQIEYLRKNIKVVPGT